MGLFTTAIPLRKWTGVAALLSSNLRADRAAWFDDLIRHEKRGGGLRAREITPQIGLTIAIFQFCVAAERIRESAYVKKISDFNYVVDLTCMAITGKRVEEVQEAVIGIMQAGGMKAAVDRWTTMMLPLVAEQPQDSELKQALSQWAMGLVATTMVSTCAACGDQKSARKIAATLLR
jgi:hypothetical protein